jgi:peptidoglycan hydrolase-like amidase
MSTAEVNPTPPEEPTFEQTLQTIEANVSQLKARYRQVQQDQTRQTELQARQTEIARQPECSQDLKGELAQIETELQELELRLESQLFSWDHWKQYFWQTVRFIGLGMAIGWGMAFYVMKHPVPGAIEPNRPEQFR